jgi:hypothetical protein
MDIQITVIGKLNDNEGIDEVFDDIEDAIDYLKNLSDDLEDNYSR